MPAKHKNRGEYQSRSKYTKFDVLKKKALILFQSAEAGREAYHQSKKGKLVFDGVKIKLSYKFPRLVEKILTQRKEAAKEAVLQKEPEKEVKGGEEDLIDKPMTEKNRDQNKNSSLGVQVISKGEGIELDSQEQKTKIVEKNKKETDQLRVGLQVPRIIPTSARSQGMASTPVFKSKEYYQKETRNQKIEEKFYPKAKIEKNRKNRKFRENRRIIEKSQGQQLQELTQGELLKDLPKDLQRRRNQVRPCIFGGFWGVLSQKREEHRRHFKPGQKQYNHTEHKELINSIISDEENLQINIKKSDLVKPIPSSLNSHPVSTNTQFRQFRLSCGPFYPQGDQFHQFSF